MTRPRLSEEDVHQLAAAMQKAYKWDAPPKDFQLKAVQAQIEGVDIIVQAPTGSGKTALAAGPHVWPGNEGKFTLMVCPLLSLEEEMVRTFDTDFGLKAIALNSKNGACSPLDILALKYQIILVSPEMLQSRTFTDRVLRNASFMRNIISMFIDEAHCIVHWGADFRKQYGTLGKIRVFLPPGTPVIAVTATLTARVRRTIHSSLHFAQSDVPSRFINKGNDRPNVSIVVRACEHPLNTYADLDFVIPESALRNPSDIPKTYIYVDNIATGGEIIDYLNARLHSRADASTNIPHGIVRPFNATMSHEYRTLAMEHFREGNIRILVCTDAAGMGCNIPDIDRVVQWKLPATFSNFIQRAGRAARGRGRKGLAVLLVEKSAYNTDLVSEAAPSTGRKDVKKNKLGPSAPKADPKEVKEYARAHGAARGGTSKLDANPDGAPPILNPDAADEGLLTFVQSTTCRRQVWAKAYILNAITDPLVPCCDICRPELLDQTRPGVLPPQPRAKNMKQGLPDFNAQDKLREWRKELHTRDHRFALFDETAILDDTLITTLSSVGPLTIEQVANVLKEKWIFNSRYGRDLASYVHGLKPVFTAIPSKPR
ncbi:P-loop containing nucleoside triphosphate hydrolase protein, partial [Cerioporus squamosus]